MAAKASKNPFSPVTEADLANARQIVEVANGLLPILQKAANCGVEGCPAQIDKVTAMRDFAQAVVNEYGAGDTAV